MNRALGVLFILTYSSIASSIIAQAPEFNDGIYTNVEMVKNNRPLPLTWIVSEMEVDDRNFYKNLMKSEQIIFFDDNGVRTSLETKSIWGYSHKGDLYINVGGAFHKIDFFGRISHFVASKSTYAPLEILEGQRDIWYNKPVGITIRNRKYLLDIEENKVWDFDLDGLERVLENDPELLNEYEALKDRKKEKMKYVFLRRYNEKYPLNIPLE